MAALTGMRMSEHNCRSDDVPRARLHMHMHMHMHSCRERRMHAQLGATVKTDQQMQRWLETRNKKARASNTHNKHWRTTQTTNQQHNKLHARTHTGRESERKRKRKRKKERERETPTTRKQLMYGLLHYASRCSSAMATASDTHMHNWTAIGAAAALTPYDAVPVPALVPPVPVPCFVPVLVLVVVLVVLLAPVPLDPLLTLELKPEPDPEFVLVPAVPLVLLMLPALLAPVELELELLAVSCSSRSPSVAGSCRVLVHLSSQAGSGRAVPFCSTMPLKQSLTTFADRAELVLQSSIALPTQHRSISNKQNTNTTQTQTQDKHNHTNHTPNENVANTKHTTQAAARSMDFVRVSFACW